MGIMEAPKTWSDLKEGRELQPSRDKANQSDDEGTLIQRQERAVPAELEPAEPRARLKATAPLAPCEMGPLPSGEASLLRVPSPQLQEHGVSHFLYPCFPAGCLTAFS